MWWENASLDISQLRVWLLIHFMLFFLVFEIIHFDYILYLPIILSRSPNLPNILKKRSKIQNAHTHTYTQAWIPVSVSQLNRSEAYPVLECDWHTNCHSCPGAWLTYIPIVTPFKRNYFCSPIINPFQIAICNGVGFFFALSHFSVLGFCLAWVCVDLVHFVTVC